MIYIIDHNDSFTFNVVHQFSKFDKVICDNYDRVNNDILEKASFNRFISRARKS
jgi:anthranilate/para-aminobenzoate synthase component II